ncbi:MAG: TraB/GumN family protein [Paracoccus sp. (in: a-proteobacteria)]|uniref:TraB/GumN family protein n=1 Tax=Paracoccus sp. TaxID=267 RepID=UPI0026DFD37B|nr:TraB/GumN family protein [Paracoccus sp. (in: a-proteobacteria)]MDO5613229.1 TraB/GumN family protein [Paracoccus sp. (in: a-proteobacteria)]
MMLKQTFAAASLMLAATAADAATGCVGRDLIAELPQAERDRIAAAVADVPYHQGLLWQASRDDAQITIVGTYHFADPRHQATMQTIAPALSDAALVMVEAGPEEQEQLTNVLALNPSLMVDADGPTLPERLSDDEWDTLSSAMAERGMPAIMTAKLRPWYVSLMLGISPCMMATFAESGIKGSLDDLLIQEAVSHDIPIRALEPWDTVFTLFSDLTPDQEIGMLRVMLPQAEYADDYAVTLSNAYFSGDVWQLWEFGRLDAENHSGLSQAEVEEQFTLAEDLLMNRRNQNWIAPLIEAAETAAQDGKGIVAGFGALHLPGEQGVLNLLAGQGWTIERLDG